MSTPGDPRKRIVLVRHGESEGQACSSQGISRSDPVLLDCGLTRKGISQAKGMWPGSFPKPELIVTSPLKRALLTTLLAFPANDTKIVCHPSIRERGSKIPENRLRPLPLILEDEELSFRPGFAEIDFTLVAGAPMEEPDGGEANRAYGGLEGFVRWLAAREETNIVVVCHHNVILQLLAGQRVRPVNCVPVVCLLAGEAGREHLITAEASREPQGSGEGKGGKGKKGKGGKAGRDGF